MPLTVGNPGALKELIPRISSCQHQRNILIPKKRGKPRFNMARGTFVCGAPADIAGHCRFLMRREPLYNIYPELLESEPDQNTIMVFLGCCDDFADYVFCGKFSAKYPSAGNSNLFLRDITVKETVDFLRTLLPISVGVDKFGLKHPHFSCNLPQDKGVKR